MKYFLMPKKKMFVNNKTNIIHNIHEEKSDNTPIEIEVINITLINTEPIKQDEIINTIEINHELKAIEDYSRFLYEVIQSIPLVKLGKNVGCQYISEMLSKESKDYIYELKENEFNQFSIIIKSGDLSARVPLDNSKFLPVV